MVNQSFLLGYALRLIVGIILALVLGVLGVIIGRMALVFFGLISWGAWFSSILGGASIGAGLGCLIAWLWLRHSTRVFSTTLLMLAILAGAAGGWGGYWYGQTIEVPCCVGRDVGAQEFTVFGATAGANLMSLCVAVTGHLVLGRRRLSISRGTSEGAG